MRDSSEVIQNKLTLFEERCVTLLLVHGILYAKRIEVSLIRRYYFFLAGPVMALLGVLVAVSVLSSSTMNIKWIRDTSFFHMPDILSF